jgi:gliding motility-associated-like protein
VLPSNIATINDIIIEEASTNNTITVLVSGEGDYEFALDYFGSYQDSNVFTNVTPGFHTVFIRDKNGCGIVEEVVSVLGFPKFFTPNNDGFNDTWQLYGVNSQFNQGTSVTIFDRYGKLISSFDNNSIGWDGTLNGKRLPSSDYWFVAKLPNGKEYRGHFALVR